jgi:hypothetical protein
VFAVTHDAMKTANYFDTVPHLQQILANIMLAALQTAGKAGQAIGNPAAVQEGIESL